MLVLAMQFSRGGLDEPGQENLAHGLAGTGKDAGPKAGGALRPGGV